MKPQEQMGLASKKLTILDCFVASTVLTIVGIRLFLEITGYPQIGGNGLHIAHMLWGGIGLTVLLLYTLLTEKPHHYLVALFGGVSFGFFIDEIGKFVTSDNDYFFSATAFLIYSITLSLWLVARFLIVRSYSGTFLSPADWPKNRLLQRAIVLYAIAQALLCSSWIFFSILYGKTPFGLDGIVETLVEVIVIVLVAILFWGLYLYKTGYIKRSATYVRLYTLLFLVVIYPFILYRNAFGAVFGCLVSVAVVLALSEASLKSILLPKK